MLEDAYRQNRMSTAAAVRHLHSLHVKAPIFGLVWSDESVRAHVDWCVSKEQEPPVRAISEEKNVVTHPPRYDRWFDPRYIQACMEMGATPTNGICGARPTLSRYSFC
jgi:hypothetical protein